MLTPKQQIELSRLQKQLTAPLFISKAPEAVILAAKARVLELQALDTTSAVASIRASQLPFSECVTVFDYAIRQPKAFSGREYIVTYPFPNVSKPIRLGTFTDEAEVIALLEKLDAVFYPELVFGYKPE